jgi:hypothetical protein
MKKDKMRVKRRPYHRMSPDKIGDFALGIRNGVFVLHPSAFPTTPMTQAAFEGIIQTYQKKRRAYNGGGKDHKGPYQDARTDLMNALNAFADMVDDIPNLTSAIVMEAGFVPVKEYRSKWHVPDSGTAAVKLSHGSTSGVLHAVCSKVDYGEYYHAIVSLAPLKAHIVDSKYLKIEDDRELCFISQTMQRSKVFTGLTAGTRYYVYFLVGNGRGVSQLTEEVSIMCV